ncbi:MAG: acyl carrier protein [Acidiferrobacterales bacterium]|nr:acyl carrier protein [Acidiferrobacterales bacterium]
MADQSPAEAKMAELIVEALNLEDVAAAEIDPEAPLFGDGLGLDSIDALEIALAISQEYDVQMQAEEEHTREAFATLRSLNQFVESNQKA